MSEVLDRAAGSAQAHRGEAWWRGGVIYQVYLRSFLDTDGDGIGDLRGVERRLDHVADLGADAVWLSPFYPSPQADFGYDVSDYCGVDPVFGTIGDLDAVVARAHALGLRVILDLVCAHSSDAHPWFKDSRSSREADRADWYVWADASPDGTPPNNWLSVFGGSAWTWEPRRRQYYLHHFLNRQPALNHRSPDLRRALLEAAGFWLARGVDGFRLDAVDYLAHDPELRSNPALPPVGGVVPAKPFGLQDHVHDMMHVDGDVFLAELRELCEARGGAVLMGELSSQPGAPARIARLTGPGGPLHMAYSLASTRGEFGLPLLRRLVAESGSGAGWTCWTFGNHDTERVATRWGGGDARVAGLAMSLLLTLRGSACVFQGEELALPDAELPFEDMRDPFSLAYWPLYRGRDCSRTPMPWTGTGPYAGFSAARPWLPLPSIHATAAVALQALDRTSPLSAWKRFLRLRNGRAALVRGGVEPLGLPAPLLGFVRAHGQERIACLFNMSGEACEVPGGLLEGAERLWPTPGDCAQPVEIGPWQALLAALPRDVPPRD
jgi:alpha-glucosidase